MDESEDSKSYCTSFAYHMFLNSPSVKGPLSSSSDCCFAKLGSEFSNVCSSAAIMSSTSQSGTFVLLMACMVTAFGSSIFC